MTVVEIVLLSLLIFAASYIQTVTGFALGLVAMGAVALFALAPVGFAAIVVSFAILVNTVAALLREHHHIDRDMTLTVAMGLIPGVPLGVWLLDILDGSSVSALRITLGVIILGSAVLLMLRPHPRLRRSAGPESFTVGTLSGLLAGLFSIGGPPLVYHLYRQPMPLDTVRTSLLAILFVSTSGRLLYIGGRGELTADVVEACLWTAPTVVAGTVAGRHLRPPLSDLAMRRLAFALLAAVGMVLLGG